MGAVTRNEGWILAFFSRLRRNGEGADGVTSSGAGHSAPRLALSAAKPNIPAIAKARRLRHSRLRMSGFLRQRQPRDCRVSGAA